MPDGLSHVYLKACISPDLERSDFHRQSFQYTWLSSYLLFSSIRESLSFAQAQGTWPSPSSFNNCNRAYSINCWHLRYLISFIPAVWLESIPISLCKTTTSREAVIVTLPCRAPEATQQFPRSYCRLTSYLYTRLYFTSGYYLIYHLG